MQNDAANQVVTVFQYPVSFGYPRERHRCVHRHLEQAFFQELDDYALIVACLRAHAMNVELLADQVDHPHRQFLHLAGDRTECAAEPHAIDAKPH